MESNTFTFNNWTQTEIRAHISWLERASQLTLRSGNKAIELNDGIIRVATLGEDKTWSGWEEIEAPNLNISGGKLVVDTDDGKLLPKIRVAASEVYELCKTSAKPWSKNEIDNVYNYGEAELVIEQIISGRYDAAQQLTTRTLAPGRTLQTDLTAKLVWEGKRLKDLREDETADSLYQTNEWIRYYPYNEKHEYWVPVQEIAFLEARLVEMKQKDAASAVPKQQVNQYLESKTAITENLQHIKRKLSQVFNELMDFLSKR